MSTDTPTTITRAQELQLIGLLALADHYNGLLADIERAAAQLLGVQPDATGYTGHIGDMIWSTGPSSAALLLDRLQIQVAPHPETAP